MDFPCLQLKFTFFKLVETTFVCISSSVVMQYLHFLNAECNCLNPPIEHAARLSAEILTSVPFISPHDH